jgi:hypothetical protein
MTITAPRRLTALAAIAILLVTADDARAQFRPGVFGTRGPRWASSVRGRIVQTGLAIGAVIVLVRVLRPELRRSKRKWNSDDLNSPENAEDFWTGAKGPG